MVQTETIYTPETLAIDKEQIKRLSFMNKFVQTDLIPASPINEFKFDFSEKKLEKELMKEVKNLSPLRDQIRSPK